MTKKEIIEYVKGEMREYYGSILEPEELNSILELAAYDDETYDLLMSWERTTEDGKKDDLLFQMEECVEAIKRNPDLFFDCE